MSIREKLNNLRLLDDRVLFRWRAGTAAKHGKQYILLSGLRFESLSSRNGVITFSSAAGYLTYIRQKPRINFTDRDLIVARSGPRQGCNFPLKWWNESDGELIETPCCKSVQLGEPPGNWEANKVLSMGNSPYYALAGILQPTWYRESKSPKTALQFQMTPEVVRAIGGANPESLDELKKLFVDNLEMFGQYTEQGYVIPFEYVARGGRVVCASRGIVNNGCVYGISGAAFRAECAKLHWDIATARDVEEAEVDAEIDLEGLIKRVAT